MLLGKRQTVSVSEAAELVGVHRLTLYSAIRRGELRVVRVGRRVLVPVDALEHMLKGGTWSRSSTGSGREEGVS